MKRMLAIVALVLPAQAAWAGAGCGMTDPPCEVANGNYFAAAPLWRDGDPARPAVIFLHGAGGSGEATAADQNLATPITARGYVLLAPSGLPRPERDGLYWSLGTRPPVRDEAAFLTAVVDDATIRFHLDRGRIFLAGFSMGAGLVWQLACQDPTAFAAYGPVAGGFWRGQPNCAGPVRMLLTQGWRDDAVPLEGWSDRQNVVGNVFDGVEVWRQVNGCPDPHGASYADVGLFWQRSWVGCAQGSDLTFVLHPGGHEVPKGWADMALDWFESTSPVSH